MIKENLNLEIEMSEISGYDKVFVKIYWKSERNIIFSAWIDKDINSQIIDVIANSAKLSIREVLLNLKNQL